MSTAFAHIGDLASPGLLREKHRARERRVDAETRFQAINTVGNLYDRYADDVFGLTLWLLGSQDEAREAVQDTFVRLLTWKGSLSELREPRAFVLRAARTAAFDRIRRRRSNESLEESLLLAPASDNPETRARAHELSRALATLPDKQREAIYLRFFVGLSFREIGRVTRVPTFTVASRCRLGLAKLEKRMAGR